MTNQNKAKTRDEQILEQSYEYELTIPNDFDDVLRSAEDFVEGAKWADQNPSPEVQGLLDAFNIAVIRMGIMQDRMMNCHLDSEGKNHGLIDESESFYHEAREALETYRKVTSKE